MGDKTRSYWIHVVTKEDSVAKARIQQFPHKSVRFIRVPIDIVFVAENDSIGHHLLGDVDGVPGAVVQTDVPLTLLLFQVGKPGLCSLVVF